MNDDLALQELGKSQFVRVLDVVLIGPVMMWGGVMGARAGSPVLGLLLIAFGILTIAFNGVNWRIVRDLQEGEA